MSGTTPYRLLISGGGTGGHVYPAIAIASEFRSRFPDAEVLFVGAQGKMEMTRVPQAGFRIIGLWISGLQRSLSLSNLLFPVKLLVSYVRAIRIVRTFRPDVVVGTGGYASGPIMLGALRLKIPTLIQEQNSFAGLTNRRLGAKVNAVCVAYPGMEKYFPAGKIRVTGNPVRSDIRQSVITAEEGRKAFGLNPDGFTLLVLGGSLGARTINEAVAAGADTLNDAGIQILWQTGRIYFEEIRLKTAGRTGSRLAVVPFIEDMKAAYAAADLVVSRAGALSIAELASAGKPVVLIPSPNVADDHQTKNASSLVAANAAIMLADASAREQLSDVVLDLARNNERRAGLAQNIRALAHPEAASAIVDEVIHLIQSKPTAA